MLYGEINHVYNTQIYYVKNKKIVIFQNQCRFNRRANLIPKGEQTQRAQKSGTTSQKNSIQV